MLNIKLINLRYCPNRLCTTIFGIGFFFSVSMPLVRKSYRGVIVDRARLECSRLCGLSPGRMKSKTIKLVFVASPLSMYHQSVRAMTAWFGIRIMCLSGVTSTVKCCFSELALHA